MKNHIENIRKSVKQQGFIPTSQQIKHAIDKICPDGKDILANKSAIVAEVISYFQPSNTTDLAKINQPNEENTQTSIISAPHNQPELAPGEKQDLIASQAIALGIELSEVEVQELATNIKDNFLDYETFVENAIDTIVNYAEHRSDRLEQKIRNARKQIEGHRQQLNQTLVDEFRELNSFFRQGAAKRQQLSNQIAEAFKI
jgi:hypothetical protein